MSDHSTWQTLRRSDGHCMILVHYWDGQGRRCVQVIADVYDRQDRPGSAEAIARRMVAAVEADADRP